MTEKEKHRPPTEPNDDISRLRDEILILAPLEIEHDFRRVRLGLDFILVVLAALVGSVWFLGWLFGVW